MPDATAPIRGPNCWQCRFFAVSWDPRLPYACQRMGFKTWVLPAIEVLRADGQPCRGFSAKESAQGTLACPAHDRQDHTSTSAQPGTTRLWQA